MQRAPQARPERAVRSLRSSSSRIPKLLGVYSTDDGLATGTGTVSDVPRLEASRPALLGGAHRAVYGADPRRYRVGPAVEVLQGPRRQRHPYRTDGPSLRHDRGRRGKGTGRAEVVR